MKIAIWQTASADLRRLRERATEAAATGASVLVTPECFASGYNIGDRMAAVAQEPDGAWHDQVAAIAHDTGVSIVYGYPERDGAQVFNAVAWVDPDGSVRASQRKTHLYGDLDQAMFAAGDQAPAVFPFGDLRVGLLICYDVEFPETVRALALAGADLVVVPTALMEPADAIARVVVPARAIENQVFLAYANRVGREQELTYVGLSCVVGPDGSDLARAGSGDELVVAEIDSAALAATRASYTQLRDRRPELYGALTEEDPA